MLCIWKYEMFTVVSIYKRKSSKKPLSFAMNCKLLIKIDEIISFLDEHNLQKKRFILVKGVRCFRPRSLAPEHKHSAGRCGGESRSGHSPSKKKKAGAQQCGRCRGQEYSLQNPANQALNSSVD